MGTNLATTHDADIARWEGWEVSEDGVNWRPYDPKRDTDPLLHKRIEFAPPAEDHGALD
jgi:hypothetical protein